MPIKNYTTTIASSKTVGQIQEILGKHGAKSIMTDYEGGRVIAVAFAMDTPCGVRSFKLPANVDGVHSALKRQNVKCDRDQAERVAWRIIRDWIDAQMAIVEAGQASLDEVFMPYMLDSQGKTLYMSYGAKLLEAAKE